MMRSVYRSLLWLHPPAFRRRFAGEMLWIFDEAVPAEGPARLLFDGTCSLVRQWLVGCGAWKILAGALGAFLQYIAIAPLLVSMVSREPAARHANALPSSLTYYDVEFSRGIALVVFVLMLSTAGLALLSRRSTRG
jgi:hypothetical protein